MPDLFWLKINKSSNRDQKHQLKTDRNFKKQVRQLQKEIKTHKNNERSQDEAKCLEKLGYLHFDREIYNQAIEYWTEALRVYQELNDRKCMAESYSNIGTACRLEGDLRSAARFYGKALVLDHEFNLTEGELTSLHNLGGTWLDLGDCESALESFGNALEIAKTDRLKEWEALSLYRLGLSYQSLQQYENAFNFFEDGARIAEKIKNLEILTYCTLGLGISYEFLGDYKQAIPCYEDALIGAESLKDKNLEAIVLIATARMNIHLGILEKARELSRKVEEELGQGLSSLVDLQLKTLKADVYALQGMWEKAFVLIESAAELASDMPNGKYLADVLIKKANYELESSRYKNALEVIHERAAKYKEGDSHQVDLETFIVLGKIYRGLNRDDKALEAREAAIRRAELLCIPRFLWLTHHNLGRFHQYQNRFDLARESYQTALKWIDHSAKSLEPSLRKIFLEHRERIQVYQDFIMLQISTGHIEIAERTLNRLNSDILNRKLRRFFN